MPASALVARTHVGVTRPPPSPVSAGTPRPRCSSRRATKDVEHRHAQDRAERYGHRWGAMTALKCTLCAHYRGAPCPHEQPASCSP